jgi:MoaA/NifB/PqqE/SkfB family radical SAM enzyme
MKPLLLHYYITNRCNARCSFCSIWQEQPKIDARPDDVIANLAEAKKAGCRFVDFTGGEPLLHPQLDVFLREAKKLGLTTSVTTNCLCFQKRAQQLAGLIDLLHFSLDAGTEEMHDTLHGVPSFTSVITSIPVALANKLVPDLLFTYSDQNIDTVRGAWEIARKYKLILILDPVFNVNGSDTVSPETHAKARKYSRLPGVYLNTAHLALRKQGGNTTSKSLCKAVTSTIVITPDNNLALPCYHHAYDAVPIAGSLTAALSDKRRADARNHEGRYPWCEGCHINCYFDPSYQYMRNVLFLRSMQSKIRYARYKYCVYKHPLPT